MNRSNSLPNGVLGRTTSTVGFFHTDIDSFANWVAERFGDGWSETEVGTGSVSSLIHESIGVEPTSMRSKVLVVAAQDWSVMFTDGPLGTDTGLVPQRAAQHLGVTGIRATSSEPGPKTFSASILEIYDPNVETPHLLRALAAAHNGYTWSFDDYGEPFDFENTDAYQQRRIRDRFTRDMLLQYLRELGVPEIDLDTETRGRLVYKTQ